MNREGLDPCGIGCSVIPYSTGFGFRWFSRLHCIRAGAMRTDCFSLLEDPKAFLAEALSTGLPTIFAWTPLTATIRCCRSMRVMPRSMFSTQGAIAGFALS